MTDDFSIDGSYSQSNEIAALTVLVAVLVQRLGGTVSVPHEEADSVMNMALDFKQTPESTNITVVKP